MLYNLLIVILFQGCTDGSLSPPSSPSFHTLRASRPSCQMGCVSWRNYPVSSTKITFRVVFSPLCSFCEIFRINVIIVLIIQNISTKHKICQKYLGLNTATGDKNWGEQSGWMPHSATDRHYILFWTCGVPIPEHLLVLFILRHSGCVIAT